ncbi:MAG: hypothetical protein ACE5H9_11720 [Anaerolineae bacterium]
MADNARQDERLYFNGINGSTGDYDLPPMTRAELAGLILGEAPPDNAGELKAWYRNYLQYDHRGLVAGLDPSRLDEAGWGVIFAQDLDPAAKEALQPLLDLRREQAGELYKEYAYLPGETKEEFLERNDADSFGPADPEYVPYYLLIAGSPEAVPYAFQYQLDVQYAVGRIYFEEVEDYGRYAKNVVAAETTGARLPRRATFFAVDHDRATELSSNYLVQPLAEGVAAGQPAWELTTLLKEQATKANLAALLNGDRAPALLFTASHGISFNPDDPRRLRHQGALVCQDWPGPQKARGANLEDFYFSADDIEDGAQLPGLMVVHFACYSAGTPDVDDFAFRASPQNRRPGRPFVARLPQRLLRSGALAVLGHIDRAWSYSISYSDARSKRHLGAFKSALKLMMAGRPIGAATEYFNQRYAEFSTALTDRIDKRRKGNKKISDQELVALWTGNHDARNYVVVGDPAARLPLAAAGEAAAPGS